MSILKNFFSRSPRVSVIVPNYNHADYLGPRLDSIYGQTFEDFEVIILDDASWDHSREIIDRYRSKPRTEVIFNETNSGSVFRQWQKGIEQARGELFWIAESDDYAAPDFLEALVGLFDRYPSIGLAYTDSWLVDRSGNQLCTAHCWTDDLDPQRWREDFYNNGRDEIDRFLLQKNTIPNASAVLLRGSIVRKVGIPDPDYRLCGDWLYWMKILAVSDIAYLARSLNYWRQNSSNVRTSPGTLEWIEGEKVLGYGLEAIGADQARQNQVLLDFLRRCWQWQKEYLESLHTA
jgi:glycosyltransferase involved in cell wall biosynthesis